ncbi:hypothetical protein HAX54_033360, partial [Datura stramonium]|nr:hypothetical protein [Datura stramonium]
MAPTPTPTPPPHPYQRYQPNSYVLPNNNNDFTRAKVIFHQPQQQNHPFSLNSISGQNQNFNLEHSSRSTAAGSSIEPIKKKRGRPRKYSADANVGLGLFPTPVAQIPSLVNPPDLSVGGISATTSSKKPSEKGRERPMGSGKQKQRENLGEVGFGFTPYLINVNIVEEIGILSATGVIRKVTLNQFAGGDTMSYKGQFVITSLSGSFLLSESNGRRSRTGRLSVSLAGKDGRVFGGIVAGMLTAASPVQVYVVSFIEKGVKPNSEAPYLTQPPNTLNFGAP